MNDTKTTSYWNERWLPIAFDSVEPAPKYEVSNYGRLRSFQSGPNGAIIKGSVIQGYRSLNIRTGGKTLNRYVHKLVAQYFLQPDLPERTYVIHLDHDKLNNRVQNLRWATKEEMIEHNRDNPNVVNRMQPRRTSNYKLTESKVLIIKKLLRNDKNRLKMIARQFGITHTQLNRIRSGENWRHVVLDDDVQVPAKQMAFATNE
ncbi:NUMOD4 motif-containing HNH endonuclease [Fibrella sp. HMF5335]|uniref:NUMOD4 motif-containing HNH endonuclease n=1 Tax=Fibrella rubiginis TaxID=2817060 RepID=A0A939GHG3_9BACT|nr:HNH endonuclease signature motif containing protein [Fibrella rubiginis]MBO0938401.1 NUMOD4 motif-containing HNH endonuclease [Fibrella rubiginis]